MRDAGRGMERGGTLVHEGDAKGRRRGGVSTRGPRLPRVAKRLKVPFM